MMRGLLLSAYAAASHRQWANGVERWLDDVDWTRLELPPRHFAWRIRGNPLTWMLREGEALSREYDVILATSMADLATLVGLYPHLGRAHKVVYFHENQFAYPLAERQRQRGEPLMVNLYTALAADTLVFNSAYNRDSFIDGARGFLKRLPENLPAVVPLEALRDRARILPVPIEAEPASPPGQGDIIVWNHRWEYDKNPEAFFGALFGLAERGVNFRLAVMGQRFRDCPAIFDQAWERLGEHLVCWGPQSSEAYLHWLDEGALVVSTTHHEFQGLAIMEAVRHGCVPLVPDRLCFPDFYEDRFRYRDDRELETRLEAWLTSPASRPSPPDSEAWTWPALLPGYRDLLRLS
ncbi:tRNA-queuosine alpha-mannosyltransferase domain-containing protein [Halomonas elongata]|uniref:tRNA-queuosine alpha-mannosyltransferase domain-containing protein n=1 Tax=Halomonas elongata TaxID=2746 RepID=UPI0031B6068D